MAWLVRDSTVLASLEVADTFRSRLRGLLRRNGLEGALLLRPARSVHTFGMRFAIDVAHCDGDLRVLHVRSLKPWRIGPPVRHACVIIEAERGAFERWGLAVGDELAVHGEDQPTGPPSTSRLPWRPRTALRSGSGAARIVAARRRIEAVARHPGGRPPRRSDRVPLR